MNTVKIYDNKQLLGQAAADCGAQYIREAITARGVAHIIVATGASQFEMLSALAKEPGIDWSKVEIFHLDEYIDLPETHPASFRKYIRERLIANLPAKPLAFHPVSKEAIEQLDAEISKVVIDVAFIGIGENGHIAFNDPPADFETEKPYLIIKLDEVCRHQQLGEGWFPTMDDVPTHAVSMSVRQIMKSRVIVNTVPDARKAKAVQGAIDGPLTNLCPSSILREHPACFTFLDRDSSALLKK